MTSPRIVIVDYGAANPGSIRNMFRHIGFDTSISSEPEHVLSADKLVISGVGPSSTQRKVFARWDSKTR